MNLLAAASEWLDEQRRECLSVTITYNPKGGGSFEIPATLGRTLFRAENQYGLTADDLKNDPERGDTILYNGMRYEVLAPNAEPVWRWSGAYHSTRRIHTKEIGEANA